MFVAELGSADELLGRCLDPIHTKRMLALCADERHSATRFMFAQVRRDGMKYLLELDWKLSFSPNDWNGRQCDRRSRLRVAELICR